jgi:phosphatidylethanolamine/phosphatidyl-N-methylethanolamine N-methyltransferase
VDAIARDDPDRDTMLRAYQRWAGIYDVVCGALLNRARIAAAEAARDVGGRILEVGIGTGLSLEHYRHAKVELTGIDLSAAMLGKAERRRRSGRYPFLRRLAVMDAQDLAFEDGAFDCAVAQFVITLVPDPEQVLAECARVVRPGGEVILLSHFAPKRPRAARFERWIARPLHRVGLRPGFPLERLEAWAARDGRLRIAERRRLGLLGSYTLVRCMRA